MYERRELPFWVDWHVWSDSIACRPADARTVYARTGLVLPHSVLTFREIGERARALRAPRRFPLNHPPPELAMFAVLRRARIGLGRGHDVGYTLTDLGARPPVPVDPARQVAAVRDLLDRYPPVASPGARRACRSLLGVVEELVTAR